MTLKSSLLTVVLVALMTGPIFAQDSDTPPPLAEPGDTPTLFDAPELAKRYQESITAEDLAAHLYFFASDFFEGRETATPGQRMAAEYLAAQYRKIGLEPKGTSDISNPRSPEAYFQPVPLYGSRFSSSTLTASSNDTELISSNYGTDAVDGHSFLMFGSGDAITGGVVFAGYGIADDELGYNDYAAIEEAGIDYSDDWLMILSDEPMSDAQTSLLSEDGALTDWTTGRFDKFRAVINSGSMPKGILVVGDTSPRQAMSVADRARAQASNLGGVGSLSLDKPDSEEGSGGGFVPVYIVSTEFANGLLRPSGHTVGELQSAIDETMDPTVMEIGDVTLNASITNERYETRSENVVAFIEGSDPALKNEYVVLSSHYDHIGVGAGEGDVINNGADDDGSGTVTILEIAEAFAKAKADGYGPRRSLIFLNVTGEEKGLLGSAYYSDRDPIVPIEQTVTNLNIDMIGRIDPTHPGDTDDYVYIIGSKLISQELHDINVRANEVVGANLDLNERFNSKDDPNRFYARSDHWNFGKHGVPFIFFFTGTHEDYHGVGDEPHKIEYERMERIAQVIFGTAWQVANQDSPPAVSGEGFN